MDMFYEWLGSKKTRKIRLAVMDMWKAFEKSTGKHAQGAAILYDKFHVMRHLGEALDRCARWNMRALGKRSLLHQRAEVYALIQPRASEP